MHTNLYGHWPCRSRAISTRTSVVCSSLTRKKAEISITGFFFWVAEMRASQFLCFSQAHLTGPVFLHGPSHLFPSGWPLRVAANLEAGFVIYAENCSKGSCWHVTQSSVMCIVWRIPNVHAVRRHDPPVGVHHGAVRAGGWFRGGL